MCGAGHNRASWKSLAESIAQTLTPSMWGISMVRALLLLLLLPALQSFAF
jgi:hypothetical protein